ncbi:MAG: hypothetical protein L0I93_05510 [Atopostipes suicloacalis]|nr:hypothetical protein [Atopostipes suicloacalis]
MVFERKETESQKSTSEVKSYFWTFLKWYWVIIPSIYFLFALPEMLENMEGGTLSFNDISILFFQILNFIMAANMFLINPLEQSKAGIADKFLKIGAFQQIFAENIFGFILIILAWYQLPKSLADDYEAKEDEIKYIQPKKNIIIAIVSTILTLLIAIARIVLI